MEGKRIKFLELLSQEISNGSDKFDFESLTVHLDEAIKALPEGDLKNDLLNQTKDNSERLWSLIESSKKTSEMSFDIFNENGLQETLKKIKTLKSPKEQLFHLSQAALCLPSKEVFDLLLKAEDDQKTNQSKLQTLINVTELCGQLTVGCNNLKVLHDLMQFFLSEVGNVYGELMASSQPEASWLELKDIIFGLLMHSHLQYHWQKEKHNGDFLPDATYYRDLLAAILSLYIDVIITIDNRDEVTSDHVSTVVFLLLGDSPSHVLDTVNQISNLNEKSVQMIFPFLRKVLSSTGACCTEFINYIKYICVARRVLKWIDKERNDVLSIKKLLNTVSPQDGFVSWISDKDESLVNDLNLSGLPRDKITEHLLEISSDDTMERLLDFVTEVNEGRKISTKVPEDDGNAVEDDIDSSALFFVDSQGSSELLEQCKAEEFTESKSDKMLKKQIDAMLERLEPDSEDEKDDLEISFDDHGKEESIAMGNVDAYSSQNDQEKITDPIQQNDTTILTPNQECAIDITVELEDINSPSHSAQKIAKRKRKSGSRSIDSIAKTAKESGKKKKTRKIPIKSGKS